MRSELQRVLELQPLHDSLLTPAMSERGVLVRKEIPAWLDSHAAVLGQALGVGDFFAEGSNGAGRNARVPWTRFASRFESPKPTEGFYVVYLFDAAGGNVYLSLNQGTTDHLNGELVRKPPELILERSAWARVALGSWLTDLGDRLSIMSLNGANLGDAYEDGSVAAIGYERDAIPDDSVILADAKRFAEGLGLLYREHNLRPLPKEQPEIHEAEVAADRAAGNRRVPPRAGFRANAAERKAIEKRAIDLARAYYMAQGFKVKELGKPFDLEVRKDGMKLTVEVKGTTSDGSGVVLTANEVEHHAEAFPNNALVIVRGIALDREGDSPTADGGHLYELRGWEIDRDHLRTISYAYEVPATMYNHVGVQADELL